MTTLGGYIDYDGPKDTVDLHTHSPTRHDTRYEPGRFGFEGHYQHALSNVPQWAHKSITPAMIQKTPSMPNWPNLTAMDPRFSHPNQMNFGILPDPFIEPGLTHQLRQSQRSIDDVSMPDAGPISVSSRAMSSIAGMSFEHSHQPSIVSRDDDCSIGYCDARIPSKIQTTASSTQHTAILSMPPVSRPSAAAQARSESYSKNASRAVSQADPKDFRQVSGSSARSSQAEHVYEIVANRKTIVSPKVKVKGKKESKASSRKNASIESEPVSEPSSREVSKPGPHNAHVESPPADEEEI